jgi:hypothetical protein
MVLFELIDAPKRDVLKHAAEIRVFEAPFGESGEHVDDDFVSAMGGYLGSGVFGQNKLGDRSVGYGYAVDRQNRVVEQWVRSERGRFAKRSQQTGQIVVRYEIDRI